MSIWNILVTTCIIFLVHTDTQSTDDDQPYTNTYNSFVPSSVNFQDIYTSTLNRLANDPTSEEQNEIPINSISTQFVEFHPKTLKISRITVPPKVLLNSSYIKKTTEALPTTTIINTPEEEEPLKVIPIKNHHRGVLDLLFPAARVRTFKTVFDSVRRILSSTF